MLIIHMCCGMVLRFREILINLVGNAFKYTPEGGNIAIDVKELNCTRSGYVRIQTQVNDYGCWYE